MAMQMPPNGAAILAESLTRRFGDFVAVDNVSLRVERAASLLGTSFLTIKEIAFQTGSGDISHFVRDFKKYYGVTPGEFRLRGKRSPA